MKPRITKNRCGNAPCQRCGKSRQVCWAAHNGLPVTLPLCTRCYKMATKGMEVT